MPNPIDVDKLIDKLLTKGDKPIMVRPIAMEISLAFNPKNGRHFFMRKDGTMPKVADILKDQNPLPSQEKIIKLFNDTKMTKDAQEAMTAALRLVLAHKDDLPKGFFTSIAKNVSELGNIALIEQSGQNLDEIRKAIRAELLEEMKKDNNEFATLKVQFEKMEKDLAESNKRLEKAEDERSILEIKKDLQGLSIPGNIDEIARTAHSLGKINEELKKNFLKQQKDMAGIVAALGMEHAIGAGRVPPNNLSDAAEKISALVREEMKKDAKLSQRDAYKRVVDMHKDLYVEYLKGRK